MPVIYGVSDETVREILTTVRTIAVVGASPNPARPSNEVMGYLVAKGFETYPVNPWHAGGLIRGRPTYARLADVPALIDMVDVFRNSALAAGGAVDDALNLAPLPAVIWMQARRRQRRGGGAGARERRYCRHEPLPEDRIPQAFRSAPRALSERGAS